MQRTVLEDLTDIRALLAKPDAWRKGRNAADARGRSVSPRDPKAVSWCLNGALTKVGPVDSDIRRRVLLAEAMGLRSADLDRYWALTKFNDAAETTHDVLLARLDKAIERMVGSQTPGWCRS